MLSELEKSKLNKIDNLFPPYTGTSYDENDLKFLFKQKNITIKKRSPNYVAKIINDGFPIAIFSITKSEFGQEHSAIDQ